MADIIDRILQGEENAVIEFYQAYSPKVFRYLSYKTKKEDAEEILQDTFLEALDSLALFQRKSSIASWLHSIAHNKMVDFYRKRKMTSLISSQFPFLQLLAHEISEPEFQFEKNKIRDSIENTFHKLSAKYQHILRLHYEEEMPVRDIAVKLNLSFKATESLLFRARQEFKQLYAAG